MQKLSKLQQELFYLMETWIEKNWNFVPGLTEDGIDTFLEDLKDDLKTMDAIDLRQNIKIWKDKDW